MSGAIGVALVLAAVVVVIVAVRLIGRWQRPTHPPIDLSGITTEPGLVVFTSTDCANCREALAVAESLGVPIRQVAWELEPAVFARAGVEAVPLTAVVDSQGRPALLSAGVPSRRRLTAATKSVGLEAAGS